MHKDGHIKGKAGVKIRFLFVVASRAPSLRGDVNIPTYKPHTNHKRSSVRSHTLAPTSICDLSNSLCWSPLTDLGHISSVTYVCHPLWFVCGHRKGFLTSPLRNSGALIRIFWPCCRNVNVFFNVYVLTPEISRVLSGP